MVKRPAFGILVFAAIASWVGVCAAEWLMWEVYIRQLSAEEPGSTLQVVGELLGQGISDAAPILLWCVVGLAALVLLLYALSKTAGIDPNRLLDPARTLLHRISARALLPLAVGLAVFISSCLYWNFWYTGGLQLQEACSAGVVEAELTDDSAERDYGTVSAVEVHLDGRTCQARMIWPEDAEVQKSGALIEVEGSILLPQDSDGGRWNHQQGNVATIKATQVSPLGYANGPRGWIAPFRDASFTRLSAFDEDIAGVLSGIILADRTIYSGSEVEQNFQTTGLAHLMAVSGTHLAVVAALLGFLLNLFPLSRRTRVVFLTVCLGAYVVLTGFSPSAMRAAVMSIVGFGAGLVLRRKDVLNALALCVLVFLVVTPSVAFSVGFELSVLAVAGLLVLTPLLQAWLDALFRHHANAVSTGVSAAIGANLTTLPLTIPLFSQLPLITPIASPIAAPLVTLVLGFGITGILAALVPGVGTFLASALLALAAFFAEILVRLVSFFASLPFACVPMDADSPLLIAVLVVVLLVVIVWWPLPASDDVIEEAPDTPTSHRHGRFRLPAAVRPILASLLLFAVPLVAILVDGLHGVGGVANIATTVVESDAEVVMLDVGQGDSMLIHDGSAAVLVDTGEEGDVLKRALARHGISHLDAVILTHKDIDHTGALGDLAGVVTVSHVYIHADLLDQEGEYAVLQAAQRVSEAGGAEGIRPGAQIHVGSFTLTMLAPEDGGESENEDSLINLLEYDVESDGDPEARGLLTGDAEEDEVAVVYQMVGDVDFVKVGHHGSRDAFSAEELEVLRPEVALIGVGIDNSYGHPTPETLAVLEDCGATVFRTDLDGDISVAFSADTLSVTTQSGL